MYTQMSDFKVLQHPIGTYRVTLAETERSESNWTSMVSFTIQNVTAMAGKQPKLGLKFKAFCVASEYLIWTSQTLSVPITQNVSTRTAGISLNFCM
jgi:hypothetical protein